MKALFVIGIILFNLFLLLATPSFGQEGESAGQHEGEECLEQETPCEKWEPGMVKICPLSSGSGTGTCLSPIRPDQITPDPISETGECRFVPGQVCVKWGGTLL